MFRLKHSAFLLTLSLFVASFSFAAPTKILPLGDSITSGASGYPMYRDNLNTMLIDAGYDFEFVGSLTGTSSLKHEGHSGIRVDEVDTDIVTWLQGYDVDIALVHLGTNDVMQGKPDATTVTELESVISKLKAEEPNVKMFVAKILPLGDLQPGLLLPDLANDFTNGFNARLTGPWATTNEVTIVDQYTNFIVSHMRPDTIHPNAPPNTPNGEDKMAQNWFDKLKASALIPPVLTLTSPVSTTGGAPFSLSIATASNGNITYSTSSTGICAVDPTSGDVTPQAAGSCVIIATQGAIAGYAQAVSNTVSIAVTESPQKLVFDSITVAPTYGDDPFTIKATSFNTNTPAAPTGLVTTVTSLTTATCTYSANTKKVTIIKAGQCTLEAKQAGGISGTDANRVIYAPATSVTKNITIAKAEQNITFDIALPLNKTFGDAPFGVTATSFNTKTPPVATGLSINIGTTTANVCTYNAGTKKVTILSAGTCTLKAVQGGDDKFKAKTETIPIIISAKGQTINFPTITDKVVNNVPFDISATASSTLAVTFSSTTTNVCTVSNKTVTLVAVGTCRITASAGNSNNTTASATQEFQVIKASQTVVFENDTPTTKTNKDSPFTINVSSTSNLVVTLNSTSTNVCTVGANNKVSIHRAGSCTLKAEQAGNATYKAASTTHTIIVSAVDTTYDTVVEIINSSGNTITTTAQLKAIGLKNINTDFDYTKALKNGTYKNKSEPTIAELQIAIDNENKAEIKTAGSTSVIGLMLFGFMALYRRKKGLF